MKKRKVVIIGGGVAGLSAAHELTERDFEVTVYERNRILGGKARSIALPRVDPDKQPLPGEHGFRFFPGWYRHLTDTMSRIPYPKTGKSVKDNLVAAEVNVLASYDRDPISAVVRFPQTWERVKLAFRLPQDVLELIPADDIEFFFRRMSQFVMSCEERRLQEVEPLSWWEYMEADRRSVEFRRYVVKGATQNSIAARAETASAYTVAKLVVQTFLDAVIPGGTADRVLNGPTQEVWIDPWRKYLEEQGVEFKLGYEFDGFDWGEREQIDSARFSLASDSLKLIESKLSTLEFLHDLNGLNNPTPLDWQRLRQRAEAVADQQLSMDDATSIQDLAKLIDPVLIRHGELPKGALHQVTAAATELQKKFSAAFLAAEPDLQAPEQIFAELSSAAGTGLNRALPWQMLNAVREAACHSEFASPFKLHAYLATKGLTAIPTALEVLAATVAGVRRRHLDYDKASAEYFVLALPIEQAAYYVNREPTLTALDGKLEDLVRLSEHVEWMAGIQFFLKERVNVTRGHIDCLDSEWALTAISSAQFWDDIDLKERGDGTCKSILSVDISSWYTLGGKNRKAAWDCTAQEIAEETWDQLKRSLNRVRQSPVLSDAQLIGGKLTPNVSFFLDDSIIDRFDRKKQGLFEKYRRVAFDGGVLAARQLETRRATDAPEAFGSRLAFNSEPLLVNRAGALALRPSAKTGVRNLFLAADYVATSTNLACMEGANEAARLAVNAILASSGYKKDRCAVWPLSEPLESARIVDKQLFERGQRLDVVTDMSFRVAGATSKVATEAATKAWRFFKDRF